MYSVILWFSSILSCYLVSLWFWSGLQGSTVVFSFFLFLLCTANKKKLSLVLFSSTSHMAVMFSLAASCEVGWCRFSFSLRCGLEETCWVSHHPTGALMLGCLLDSTWVWLAQAINSDCGINIKQCMPTKTCFWCGPTILETNCCGCRKTRPTIQYEYN